MITEPMTIVAVDIGNTSTQLAAYQVEFSPVGQQSTRVITEEHGPPKRLGPLCRWSDSWSVDELTDGPQTRRCWAIASVNSRREHEFSSWLGQHFPTESMQHIRPDQVGIAVNLGRPDRVGIDRLLAAAAAHSLPPFHVSKIIVDAGTAVTVDLIDACGIFQGGTILAGRGAMSKALNEFAEKLPDLKGEPMNHPVSALGKTTEESLASGLYWGTVGAVREGIQQLTRRLDKPPVIITTGGDAEGLPIPAEWVPDLVLMGIARVGSRLF